MTLDFIGAGEIRPGCARSPQGHPTLAKKSNQKSPTGGLASPPERHYVSVQVLATPRHQRYAKRQGCARHTRCLPTSCLPMRKAAKLHRFATWLCQQNTALRVFGIEMASSNTAVTHQVGSSCHFFGKLRGLVSRHRKNASMAVLVAFPEDAGPTKPGRHAPNKPCGAPPCEQPLFIWHVIR